MSQPFSAKSTASQSSSSGWLGHSACEPKFSEVFTKPVPKKFSQARLTQTRAVKGCWPFTSQRAKPRRLLGSPAGRGGSAAGSFRSTFAPGLSYSPRSSTKASLGWASSFITMTSRMPGRVFLVFSKPASWASAARFGCSGLSVNALAITLRSSAVRAAGSLRISARSSAACGVSFKLMRLEGSPVVLRRKRPTLWLARVSQRKEMVRVAPAGTVVGVRMKRPFRGTRFSASLPAIAQPAPVLARAG